jgi:hypothetical protein
MTGKREVILKLALMGLSPYRVGAFNAGLKRRSSTALHRHRVPVESRFDRCGRTRALPAGRTRASVPTLALGFAYAGQPRRLSLRGR